MTGHPIDVVVTWVDDTDGAWRDKRDAFRSPDDDREAVTPARYRDWGLLRHWFRGIERFAPWVRTVFLITENPAPRWLRLDHPKLRVLRHGDFMPERFLPTFNSRAIELNLHRIDELAEHFVYFNDDMFLCKPVEPSHFFVGGMPRAFGISNALTVGDSVSHAMLNNVQVLNDAFVKHRVIARSVHKWFAPSYGWRAIQNLALLPWARFSSLHNSHLPLPLRKSVGETLWRVVPERLEATSTSRFRQLSDLNPFLWSWWSVCTGEFAPASPRRYGAYLPLTDASIERVARDVERARHALVCLNDSDVRAFEPAKARLLEAFDRVLPHPGGFERAESS